MWSITVGVIAAMAALTSAKEMAINAEVHAELFESGVRHAEILALKNVMSLKRTSKS